MSNCLFNSECRDRGVKCGSCRHNRALGSSVSFYEPQPKTDNEVEAFIE